MFEKEEDQTRRDEQNQLQLIGGDNLLSRLARRIHCFLRQWLLAALHRCSISPAEEKLQVGPTFGRIRVLFASCSAFECSRERENIGVT